VALEIGKHLRYLATVVVQEISSEPGVSKCNSGARLLSFLAGVDVS
jgi:hypothetical protein